MIGYALLWSLVVYIAQRVREIELNRKWLPAALTNNVPGNEMKFLSSVTENT